ncbi:MAG TPA: 3-methyl-2-oxobutanoate hydroxymethyltransferase, partial [Candidatus Baltobacteraceae bacterium]|nr:3-methyl-2-oxobutanoate hydroxymethyltransferase [Candidatus Baltobacteraceae bacterium]
VQRGSLKRFARALFDTKSDSQVLVVHDVLGMYDHTPSFVKRYGDIGNQATQALRSYAEGVREKRFPTR